MNKIKTQVHTIIMLIGPSGSGKTTFANEILIPTLQEYKGSGNDNLKTNIQYISSDDIRKDILGYNYSKIDEIMTESSTQAFEILFTKLRAVTSYPINAEFVILDTTGLSEKFRNDVLDIAKDNNYNVDIIVFDYKNIDEYQKNFSDEVYQQPSTNGKIISKHIKRLKTETLKTLKKGVYKNIHKIKNKDFLLEVEQENPYDLTPTMLKPLYSVDVWDWKKYTDRILNSTYDWITIGDVHGCIHELKQLLEKYGFIIEDNEIIDTNKTKNIGLIFAGDLIDKSSEEDLTETIRFIHKNMIKFQDRFQLILGNHEEMVWKWITNHKDLEITPERLDQKKRYYNTAILLEKNEELKSMFLDIFHNMKGWVKFIGLNKRSFVVTHAPCEVKYLEKMDRISLKRQYKCASRSKNKDKTNDELTPYLKEEAVNNHPVHIFGHMGQSSVRSFKNKVCIDTGCVYGGRLTGYSIGYGKPFIQSVKSLSPKSARNDFGNNLFEDIGKAIKEVSIEDLNPYNQKRLDYIVKNGIGYIGGTISPSNKNIEKNSLESLDSGLNYFKDKVDSVVLQPKYMGSRAQLYLFKDNIEKCYATSRNGYKIREDLTDLFSSKLIEYKHIFDMYNADEIIIDGELLPWALLGKGLIETHFKTADIAIQTEIDFLDDNGFDKAFLSLKDEFNESEFLKDKNILAKKELAKKYGHKYHSYKDLKFEIDRFIPLSKHKKAWKIFNKQITLYGDDTNTDFKGFRLLKVISNNNIIDLDLTPSEHFKLLNSDDIHIVDFNDKDYLVKAERWYDDLVSNQNMEGCVIKPEVKLLESWIAPYLKVRNEEYLSIIYGYDYKFPVKFNRLLNQKNISKKLRLSISEYKLGEEMLKAPMGSKEQIQIIANLLFENEKEESVDPRL